MSTARRWLLLLLLVGCRQDMHDQPRYKPLRPSSFFADGTSARPPVPGTVARGALDQQPPVIDMALMRRGRERFDIFCSPCHGRLGNGQGMVARRGVSRPPSFHSPRLLAEPPEHFFDVITKGLGSMMSYAPLVPVRDRWAIVAYIRALQLSQHASSSDVPGGLR